MEAALAAADAFRMDDASCAVIQFWANIHETGFGMDTHKYKPARILRSEQ